MLTSIRILLVFTFLTGIVYPFLITGIGSVAFPEQSSGSPVRHMMSNGSLLLAPKVNDSTLFMYRPSAADYATVASGASNLGPTSRALRELVRQRESAFRALNGLNITQIVPADMVYASGSGLDPHISVESARLQASRVAHLRGLSQADVLTLIERYTQGPQLGFLGPVLVNVVSLNDALQHHD